MHDFPELFVTDTVPAYLDDDYFYDLAFDRSRLDVYSRGRFNPHVIVRCALKATKDIDIMHSRDVDPAALEADSRLHGAVDDEIVDPKRTNAAGVIASASL